MPYVVRPNIRVQIGARVNAMTNRRLAYGLKVMLGMGRPLTPEQAYERDLIVGEAADRHQVLKETDLDYMDATAHERAVAMHRTLRELIAQGALDPEHNGDIAYADH